MQHAVQQMKTIVCIFCDTFHDDKMNPVPNGEFHKKLIEILKVQDENSMGLNGRSNLSLKSALLAFYFDSE